jgi:hypothetical protein
MILRNGEDGLEEVSPDGFRFLRLLAHGGPLDGARVCWMGKKTDKGMMWASERTEPDGIRYILILDENQQPMELQYAPAPQTPPA